MKAGSLQVRILGAVMLGLFCGALGLVLGGADSGADIVTSSAVDAKVRIHPSAGSVPAGEEISLRAEASRVRTAELRWSVDNLEGGSPSVGMIVGEGASVSYRAPASSGAHLIAAWPQGDEERRGSTVIQVTSSKASGESRGSAGPGETHPAATMERGGTKVNSNLGLGGQAGCVPAPASSLMFDVKEPKFGAVGDGRTNDTAAIQRAVNAAAGTGGTVRVPGGTYLIDAVTSILLKSNLTFSMAPDAVLKAIPNGATNYAILKVLNADHVNILGGVLLGDRAEHLGTEGEWGHGVMLNKAKHVFIEGVTVKECWGDGFDVLFSSDVTVCSVVADHNRRQGMSITSVDGMVVRNSVFSNTSGTLPEDGIDIEPNRGERVNDVLITGCTLSGNGGYGLEIGVPISHTGYSWITGVVADGNTCIRNGNRTLSTSGRAGIEISNTSGHRITRNVCTDNQGYGILLRNKADRLTVEGNTIRNNAEDGILQYLCRDNVITGNTVTGNGGRDIHASDSSGGRVEGNTVSAPQQQR